MSGRSQRGSKGADQLKLELVGVAALALILMLSLAGVWQSAGFDKIISSTYCEVSSVFGATCARDHR